MGLNLSTLTPASLKSKNVATEEYVDTGINALTKVEDISWQSEVQAAINDNMTTIDGGKIVTNEVFVNNLNAVGGIIAESISAEEISGKIITGGQIIGANIAGVTIRASYLDLDGELEVLTNFYLCVGGNTTGVPALAISEGRYRTYSIADIDAVPSTAYSNLYRIPSISTVRESTNNFIFTTAGYAYGVMSSYNTANAGNNIKAVKPRPFFSTQSEFNLVTSRTSDTWLGYGFSYGIKNHFIIKLGTTILLEFKVELLSLGDNNGNNDITRVTISGSTFSTIIRDTNSSSVNNDYNASYNINIGIGLLLVNIACFGGTYYNNEGIDYSAANIIECTCKLLTGTNELPFNWGSGRISFQQIIAPSKSSASSTSEKTVFSLNQSLNINNMI